MERLKLFHLSRELNRGNIEVELYLFLTRHPINGKEENDTIPRDTRLSGNAHSVISYRDWRFESRVSKHRMDLSFSKRMKFDVVIVPRSFSPLKLSFSPFFAIFILLFRDICVRMLASIDKKT